MKAAIFILCLLSSINSFSQKVGHKELVGTWNLNSFNDTVYQFRPMILKFLNGKYLISTLKPNGSLKMKYSIKDTLNFTLIDCSAPTGDPKMVWNLTLGLKKIDNNSFKVQYIDDPYNIKWNEIETKQNTGIMKRMISN